MNRALAISTALAAALHGAALFGWHAGAPALLRPTTDEPGIEVSLVANAAGEPIDSPPELPPAAPERPPDPMPEPISGTPETPPEAALPERSTVESPPTKPLPQPAAEPASAAASRTPRSTTKSSPTARSIAAPRRDTGAGESTTNGSRGAATLARPRYRSNPPPEYPPEARRQHQEGVTLLDVEVSAEGRATTVRIRGSSGSALLDQAALTAVRRWTFEPGRAGGLPIASRVQVPVRFRLER